MLVVALVADRVADVVQQRRHLEVAAAPSAAAGAARPARRTGSARAGATCRACGSSKQKRRPDRQRRVRAAQWSLARLRPGGAAGPPAAPSRSPRSTAVTDSSRRCCATASRITAPATMMSARLRVEALAPLARASSPPASSTARVSWRARGVRRCPRAAAKPTTALMVPELPSARPGTPARRSGSASLAPPRARSSRISASCLRRHRPGGVEHLGQPHRAQRDAPQLVGPLARRRWRPRWSRRRCRCSSERARGGLPCSTPRQMRRASSLPETTSSVQPRLLAHARGRSRRGSCASRSALVATARTRALVAPAQRARSAAAWRAAGRPPRVGHGRRS